MVPHKDNLEYPFSELDNKNQVWKQDIQFQREVNEGILQMLIDNGYLIKVMPTSLVRQSAVVSLEQLNKTHSHATEGSENYQTLCEGILRATGYNTSPCGGRKKSSESLISVSSRRSKRSIHQRDYHIKGFALDEESDDSSPSKRTKISQSTSPRPRRTIRRCDETRRILRSSRTSSRRSSASSTGCSVESLPPLFRSCPRTEGESLFSLPPSRTLINQTPLLP